MTEPTPRPGRSGVAAAAAVVRVLRSACSFTSHIERGLEPVGGAPEQHGRHIAAAIARYAGIVRDAKIQIDR